MKNRLFVKFLAPTFLLVVAALIASLLIISDYVKQNIIDKAELEKESKKELILVDLSTIDELVRQQVQTGMSLLQDLTLSLGEPALKNTTTVNGKETNMLFFGKENQANDFDIVDRIKKIAGGTATLFARTGDEFIRVSTNVQKDDGSRAIGTILDPNGGAIKKINSGEAFYGMVDILGSPYLTGYEPIKDKDGMVIGVWYTGYKLSSLEEVGKIISELKILSNGFVSLLDNKGNVIYHTKDFEKEAVKNIIEQKSDSQFGDWQVELEPFEKWGYSIAVAYPITDISDPVSNAEFSVILGGIIFAIFIISIIALLLYRLITKPINILDKAANDVAQGEVDISVNIKSKDELGNLAISFNRMVANIKNSIEEIKTKNRLAEEATAQARDLQNTAIEQREYLAGKTALILREMNKFAMGDLSVNLTIEKDDDVGRLFAGFNTAVSNIRDMIVSVNEVVDSTARASNTISAGVEQMAAGAKEQNAQTSEVAAAMEEMAATITETTKNTATASTAARNAGSYAQEGGNIVKNTVEGMNRIAEVVVTAASTVKDLGESSKQIGEIIQVIDEIADQTNLLALNAAIEAARAGEQGRGFAVVADEVRKLAERTTKATKEIASMIKQIQLATKNAVESINRGTEEAEKGKDMASKAGQSLDKIIAGSNAVLDLISQVATASEEQTATAESVSKNVVSINLVSQETATGLQEIAKSTEDLNKLTDSLQNLVSRFKVLTLETV